MRLLFCTGLFLAIVAGEELLCDNGDDDDCASCCTDRQHACQPRNCCAQASCNCQSENCCRCCTRKCDEIEEVIEEDDVKKERNGGVNNTLVVGIQTSVNNRNEINNPVYVNSTNVNNIRIDVSSSWGTAGGNGSLQGNCCTTVEREVPVPVDRPVPVYVIRPVPVVQKIPVPYPIRVPVPMDRPVYVPSPYPVLQREPQPVSPCRSCYFCGGYYNPPACHQGPWCNPTCKQDISRRFNQPYFWGK